MAVRLNGFGGGFGFGLTSQSDRRNRHAQTGDHHDSDLIVDAVRVRRHNHQAPRRTAPTSCDTRTRRSAGAAFIPHRLAACRMATQTGITTKRNAVVSVHRGGFSGTTRRTAPTSHRLKKSGSANIRTNTSEECLLCIKGVKSVAKWS